MKTMALLILCAAMTACAVADAADTASDDQPLICGDDCDPGNFQTLLSAMVTTGGGLGVSLGPPYCHVNHEWDVDTNHTRSWSECSGFYQDPWGQRYFLDCVGWPTCDVMACGQFGQPSC